MNVKLHSVTGSCQTNVLILFLYDVYKYLPRYFRFMCPHSLEKYGFMNINEIHVWYFKMTEAPFL